MLRSKCLCPEGSLEVLRTLQNTDSVLQVVGKAIAEIKEGNKQDSRRSDSPVMRKSDSCSEEEQISQIFGRMTRGYIMLKHSENHSVPHNKFVYLSEDQKSICWKSLDKEDEKRIDLKAITRVVKEGAENHLKSLTVKNILRCVIIFSQDRLLQLQANTEPEADTFKLDLERVLKYSKSMHLNYQYKC